MALIKCRECSNEISDQAKHCPKCGWKAPSFKWWVWIPVGAIGLFVIMIVIGNLEPEYKTKARELRKICEKISTNQFECDQIYHTAIADGELLARHKANEAKAANKK